mmetsp:Transcript_111054/g.314298  ORF Transcript_111054/g.314298 Transcript_111054/m.314298 type:complete len:444 (-) Transcript_111054:140-1471(-)
MAGSGMPAPLQAHDRRIVAGEEGILKDIWQTPEVLGAMLRAHFKAGGAGEVDFPALRAPLPPAHKLAGARPIDIMAACSQGRGANFKNKIMVIGSGSSWHAALLAEYLIEHIARIPVEVQYASEFRYRLPLLRPGDTLVIISNSGETADAVESLRSLKSSPHGGEVLTLALVNQDGSTLARESDASINVMAGEELGISSTKAFSATMLALVLLAIDLGDACGTLVGPEREVIVEKLVQLPDHVLAVLNRQSLPLCEQKTQGRALQVGECVLWDISCQNVLAPNFIFLGRGFNFPMALEGSMKVKELTYIHAEGYPAAEMKHGPIALIDQFMPVVFIAPRSDPSYDKIRSNIEEVRARSGFTIVITEDHNVAELEGLCEYVISVPQTHEYLMPLVSVIPLQLLAYMMGTLKGNSVNDPRSIRKTYEEQHEPPAKKACLAQNNGV